jgi:hypothetical protein
MQDKATHDTKIFVCVYKTRKRQERFTIERKRIIGEEEVHQGDKRRNEDERGRNEDEETEEGKKTRDGRDEDGRDEDGRRRGRGSEVCRSQ